jgi:hypothetical protein
MAIEWKLSIAVWLAGVNTGLNVAILTLLIYRG